MSGLLKLTALLSPAIMYTCRGKLILEVPIVKAEALPI